MTKEDERRLNELSIKEEIQIVAHCPLTPSERAELDYLRKLSQGYDFFGLKRKKKPITKKSQLFRLIERQLIKYGIPNTLIKQIKELITN